MNLTPYVFDVDQVAKIRSELSITVLEKKNYHKITVYQKWPLPKRPSYDVKTDPKSQVWNGENERKLQSSILQALHGFYAVGGVISAPIARPFLGIFPTSDETEVSANSTMGGCGKTQKNETLIRLEDDNLQTLYTIVSAALVVIGLSILVQDSVVSLFYRTFWL